MTDEEKEKRNNLRISYFASIGVSEEDLEKKITNISAGGLALSITFIEKIVDLELAKYFWILILGWLFLAGTLFINLISIYTSRKLTLKSVDDLDSVPDENNLIKNIKRRNKIISNLDLSSLVTLLVGISFVVLFCSLNLHNKKNKTMDERDIIEKGKLIQTPSTGGNGSTGSNSGSSSSGNGSGSNSGSGNTSTGSGNSSGSSGN